jgi:flagellar biogenesis protein FliO
MYRVVRTFGLILLGTYVTPSSAQVTAYPAPTAPGNDVTWTTYQQPVAAGSASSPLALKPRESADHSDVTNRRDGIQSGVKVVGSLAIVLGIFFLVVWLLRRASPQGPAVLPAEAFEVLGRAPLANRQQVQLLRCGSKLLLVAVAATGAAATTTLTEIADPAEVDRLAGLCRQSKGKMPATSFRQVLRQVEGRHD